MSEEEEIGQQPQQYYRNERQIFACKHRARRLVEHSGQYGVRCDDCNGWWGYESTPEQAWGHYQEKARDELLEKWKRQEEEEQERERQTTLSEEKYAEYWVQKGVRYEDTPKGQEELRDKLKREREKRLRQEQLEKFPEYRELKRKYEALKKSEEFYRELLTRTSEALDRIAQNREIPCRDPPKERYKSLDGSHHGEPATPSYTSRSTPPDSSNKDQLDKAALWVLQANTVRHYINDVMDSKKPGADLEEIRRRQDNSFRGFDFFGR